MKIYLFEARPDEREDIARESEQLGIETVCSADVPGLFPPGRGPVGRTGAQRGNTNMKRGLILLTAALGLALCATGCGQTAREQPPEATDAPRYYETGTEALAQGDFAAAIDAFSQAIQTGDNAALAYLGRADSYLALAGEQPEGPSMKGLALRDYELALSLDPAVGGRVYDVYTDLADRALAEGHVDEALSHLRVAQTAAGDEGAELLDQVKVLTGEILTGAVWYQDAPDSRYYVFRPDGTGRVVDPFAMEERPLTYENEGFALRIAQAGRETALWTYEPDRESYFTQAAAGSGTDGGAELELVETTPARMYGQWLASIQAAEAAERPDWPDEAAAAAGYEALYEQAYGLLETLAESGDVPGADAPLEAARAQRQAVQEYAAMGMEYEVTARERYEQTVQTLEDLLRQGGDQGPDRSVLDQVFPVGGEVLLDYCRLLTGWTLDARCLTVPEGSPGAWESLDQVEHYFADGRLYLCLSGYALRQDGSALAAEEHGRFVIETPLTMGADVTMTGEELAAYLAGDRWVGLMDTGYSPAAFAVELRFEDGGACSVRGGHFPGGAAEPQSGTYALEGRELTLTLDPEGYSPGTYRYELIPMGESLYMKLLSDGILYGQTAGSAYVFCGGPYGAGVSERLG